MKLYCARHGTAVDLPNSAGERPLTLGGRLDIEKLACYLAVHGASVEYILHSPRIRAVETAQIFASTLLHDPQAIKSADFLDLDHCSLPAAIEFIKHQEEDTMIVSHLQFLPQLVNTLITNHEYPDIVHFRTGTVACLERYNANQWMLEWVIYPDLV